MYQLYSDYDKMNIVHVYTCTYMYKRGVFHRLYKKLYLAHTTSKTGSINERTT